MSHTIPTIVINKPSEKLQKLIKVLKERKRIQMEELRSMDSCTFDITL